MSDESTGPIPSLDARDTAAVIAILIRAVRIEDRLKKDRDAVSEATARIALDTAAQKKGIAALDIFGFESSSLKIWTAVRQAIGGEAYDLAVDEAKNIVSGDNPPNAILITNESSPNIVDNSTISDVILEYLGSVTEGVPIASVKNYISSRYKLPFHEKTPGMTLFRLQKQGLVKREGRLWSIRSPERQMSDHL